MNARTLLLGLSLLANVGLLAKFAWSPASSSLAPANVGSTNNTAVPSTQSPRLQIPASLAGLDPSAIGTYVAELRAAGFPAHLVRALVNAEINERFKAREEAIKSKNKSVSYWESDDYYERNKDTLENRLARLDLRREKDALRKQLLGEDPPKPDDTNPIPLAKRETLRRLTEDYDAMIQQAQADARGFTLASDREKLDYLRKEKDLELRALLTPEEFRAHELRNSDAARNLRWELAGFKPNEAEFALIHSLRSQNPDLARDSDNNYTQADWERRQAAEKALKESIRQQLSPERFADYSRGMDHDYRQLTHLGKRLDIPTATLNAIYDQKNVIPAAALVIAKDPTLDMETKRADLKQLAEDTRRQIVAALGTEGGEAYLKKGNLNWLNALDKGTVVIQTDDNSWQHHRIEEFTGTKSVK